jgi:hypothetical protein
MSKCLANELIDSLKEYTAHVEKAYRERPLCHFDWKPAYIAIDGECSNKVLFDMVYLDDESLRGCVSVEHLIIYENEHETKDKLAFSIWEQQSWGDTSTAKFVIPYRGDDDWYSIGSYVYSFVNEIDTLMRCY